MNSRTFEKPIETIVGLGFVRPIRTVEEAYAFLMDWRGMQGSDTKHSVALKTVKAALAGAVDAETARPFVEAFARAAGVLVPDMDGVIANAAMRGKSGQAAH